MTSLLYNTEEIKNDVSHFILSRSAVNSRLSKTDWLMDHFIQVQTYSKTDMKYPYKTFMKGHRHRIS